MSGGVYAQVVEACRLREWSPDRREFLRGMMDVFGARPIKGDGDNLVEFLQAVYNWAGARYPRGALETSTKLRGRACGPFFRQKRRNYRGWLAALLGVGVRSLFLALLFRNIAKMAFVIIAAGSRLFGGSVLLCPWFVRSTAVYDRGEVLQRSRLALVHTARVGIIVFSP